MIQTIGAEVDERFEYRADCDDFTVDVASGASEDEEDMLDLAAGDERADRHAGADPALGERALESRFAARQGDGVAPIVGRDQELGLLLERWRQARNAAAAWRMWSQQTTWIAW